MLMALLAASAANSPAQQTIANPTEKDDQAAEQRASRQNIPLPSFVRDRKSSRLEIDSVMPPGSDGSSARTVEGQIHFFDGALQQYLNVNNPYLMGRMHNAVLPFGGTAVLPVANARVEIHGGIGEIFVPYATPQSKPNIWLVQTSFGARIALDPGHHVQLGGTAYHLTDFGDKTRQWGYGAADLTIRFGR